MGTDDPAWLQRSARGRSNRLGLAVQLCTTPWSGFVPDDVPTAPRVAVNRLAVQLGVGLVELAGTKTGSSPVPSICGW
ncbi:DUF4158 domain-containing protein [Actinopolyspora halophila]|uniref:DUF4158 domain-containing protein n=1 Tax=Actinopolyspora halophila TaxID=1850 RepID=UPI000A076CAF